MKILMICDFFHQDQMYQENLLTKYYLKKGHEVTILASTTESIFDYYNGVYNKSNKPNTYYYNNFKVIRLKYSLNLLNKVRCLKGLRNAINEENPDIIYVHGFMLNLFEAIRYKSSYNCKIIYDSHADLSNSGNNWISLNLLHRVFYRFIIKFLYKKIDKIFYITPEGGYFLNRFYKIPYKYMDLLPLGADTDCINGLKKQSSKSSIRTKYNINKSDFVIFTGGKLNKIKKTSLVIELVNNLKNSSVHLFIIGKSFDEDYDSELKNLANKNPRIHFTGWVGSNEIYKFMVISDVAIFPYSQSVLWQQCIVAGLPLIVGSGPGIDANYLNRNNNIFILNEKEINIDSIKKIVVKLINDNKLLKRIKKNTFEASKFLDYNKLADQSINFKK